MNRKVWVVITCIVLAALIAALVFGQRGMAGTQSSGRQQSTSVGPSGLTDSDEARMPSSKSESNPPEGSGSETPSDENYSDEQAAPDSEQGSGAEGTAPGETTDEPSEDNNVIIIPDGMEIGGF